MSTSYLPHLGTPSKKSNFWTPNELRGGSGGVISHQLADFRILKILMQFNTPGTRGGARRRVSRRLTLRRRNPPRAPPPTSPPEPASPSTRRTGSRTPSRSVPRCAARAPRPSRALSATCERPARREPSGPVTGGGGGSRLANPATPGAPPTRPRPPRASPRTPLTRPRARVERPRREERRRDIRPRRRSHASFGRNASTPNAAREPESEPEYESSESSSDSPVVVVESESRSEDEPSPSDLATNARMPRST